MRLLFPGHFRPTENDFKSLWDSCIFAVDANVLLNLYRYSQETRIALEAAIKSVSSRIFLPHQAAKEYLKNRLVVTASQAEEYTKAIKSISDLSTTLANRKKHPFLHESELPKFNQQVEDLIEQLDAQRSTLLNRLTNDEILDFIEKTFANKTGFPYTIELITNLIEEGEDRYKNEVPPGYKDAKKDAQDDPSRKFGDLIVWKQLIDKSKSEGKPLIFITDDKKEDWWLEHSGRTISPRIELREEFIQQTGMNFWMYTVDKFIAESAKQSKTAVSEKIIEEIIEVRRETKFEKAHEGDRVRIFKTITKREMLDRIRDSERWAAENSDGFLGLKSFVHNYLGNAGFDYSASWDMIRQLEEEDLVQVYSHQGEGHLRPAKCIRLKQPEFEPFNRPLEGLAELLNKPDEKNESI